MKLGNNLKILRIQNGNMTQEALAKAIGVSRQTIISLERGRYMPSTLLALRLARFFNKPLEDVFFIIDEEQPLS
ncbi:MAG TPA: transcriptional regulator [Caldithrix abyssi]|uniref:Transcriptional regulator n=1 Tax=Caldithrix abyssi TaxID=187145 RepID=A0A7V4U4X1_CALAY|nr:transcriptional regulator [Caldithrix abyssi]